MKILISGIGGHMGREVKRLCQNNYRGSTLFGGVDPLSAEEGVYKSFSEIPADAEIDCIVDFSVHTSAPALLAFAAERKIPVVVATTGHTEEEKACMQAAAKETPVFFSANMSLGVALLVELCKNAARALPEADIEIVETHHNRKLDAPSGTALMLANALTAVRSDATIQCARAGQMKRVPGEIGIHAVRRGSLVGIHEVHFSTETQTLPLKRTLLYLPQRHSQSLVGPKMRSQKRPSRSALRVR